MLRRVFVGACVVVGVGCSSSTTVVNGTGGASGSAGVGGQGTGGAGATGGSGTDGGAGTGGTGTGGTGGSTQCVPDAGCNDAGCVQTLYSGESAPGPLYVDGANAYWVAGTTTLSLRAGPKAGGCAAQTLVADLGVAGKVEQMVGDTDAIYLGTTDPKKVVLRYDKTSKNLTVMVDNTGCSTGGYGFVAQNSTLVAYACKDSSTEIDTVTKATPLTRKTLAPGPLPQLEGIALDESGVYVANGTNLGITPFSGNGQSIYGNANVAELALGDLLYWLKPNHELWDGMVGSGDHQRYVGFVDPVVLAADGQGAYVGDLGAGDGDGRIVAAISGQPGVTMIVTKENHPTAIATDAVYIYWTNQNGTVRRGARP